MEVSEGAVLDGRYAVESLLGQGGMASVWRVRHVQLGSKHALKLLHVTTPELRARLMDEGRIQARLTHSNIVSVTDVVTLATGIGLVMPLVSGPTLRQHLEQGGMSLEEALILGAAVLDGVAHAHAAGLIHRDLKPENILLQPEGGRFIPRVADFGLAKALSSSAPGRTRAQIGMGTPGYMAPEQHRDAARVDARADVFSLGCILYELLTGRRPFDGQDMLTLYQQALRGEHPPPQSLAPELPHALSGLLTQSLRPRPEERMDNAGLLAARWRAAAGMTQLPASQPAVAPTMVQTPDAPASAETYDAFALDPEPAPASPVRPLHNISPPRDSFLGRAEEQEQLQALLADGTSLLTVLGPGGTGKTRLSQEFALSQVSAFPGGVWFCDLSEASTIEGICFAVAGALNVPLGNGDSVVTLSHAVAGRGRVLIVLDNFEQIVGHATETLERWCQGAPKAVFLVTSRAVLDLAGEQVFHLEPLPEDPAVDLFVSRAKARKRSFALTEDNASDIKALVKLLDRLPLAIELAAVRASMMKPKAMLARMGQRFRLLQGGKRGSSARQMTLKGAIDWSWDLLTDWEQAAFAQCSVFEGGFTLEAAEAVLDLSQYPHAPWPMDAIQLLVDKSLVRSLGDNALGEPRFGMYVSLHDYARDKLTAPQSAQVRHGSYFAGFGNREALMALHTHGGTERWWALWEELDNLMAATRRALQRDETHTATQAALAAVELLKSRGPFAAGSQLLQQVWMTMQHTTTTEAAGLLEQLAAFERLQGRYKQALEHCEQALLIHRELGDRRSEGATLGNLGGLHRSQGRIEQGQSYFTQSLAIHREVGDRRGEGRVLSNLGTLHMNQGGMAQALSRYEQALAIFRELGDRQFEGSVLGNLGKLYKDQGRVEQAQSHYEQALAIHREVGNRRQEGCVLGNIGNLYAEEGRAEQARLYDDQALLIHRELGNRRQEGSVLGNLGNLYMQQGLVEQAQSYFTKSLAIHREVGNRQHEGIVLGSLGRLSYEQGRPEEARVCFERALAIHREVSFTVGQGYWLCGLARLASDAGSSGWRALVDEAIEVSANYPSAQAEALAIRAELHLRHGDLAGARADVDAARAHGQKGRVAAVVALADARGCHAEGRHHDACAALEEAQALADQTHAGPNSLLGRDLTRGRELLSEPPPRVVELDAQGKGPVG